MTRPRNPPVPIASEQQEQAAVIDWWERWSGFQAIDARLLMSIPNGAMLGGGPKLRAIQMGRLKRTGLRVGAPDLFLAVPAGGKHGLWIEMKAGKRKATPEQAAFLRLLAGEGYQAALCHGADEAVREIQGYLRTSK